MKLCVLANLYGSKPLDETLSILKGMGVEAVEIGCGGYPGKAHCDPKVLLNDDAALAEFVATFKKYDVEICALAAHGNALHPDKAIAKQYHDDFVDAYFDRLSASYDVGGRRRKYGQFVNLDFCTDFLEDTPKDICGKNQHEHKLADRRARKQ